MNIDLAKTVEIPEALLVYFMGIVRTVIDTSPALMEYCITRADEYSGLSTVDDGTNVDFVEVEMHRVGEVVKDYQKRYGVNQ